MRILFVIPEIFGKAESYTRKDLAYIGFPSLTAAVIAALTPADIALDVVDEAISPFAGPENIALCRDADLVAISLNMTYKAKRAAELARQFRELGKRVIFGGVHVTSLYDFHRERFEKEIAPFADAVVIEEAELVWPKLIEDFQRGTLQKIYRSGRPEPRDIPAAKHGVQDTRAFLVKNSVQATRGCPFNCDFCSVTSFNGRVFRTRDEGAVILEVRKILESVERSGCRGVEKFSKSFVAFVDDNIAFNKNYFARLCLELEKVRSDFPAFRWGGQTTLGVIEKTVEIGGRTEKLADLMTRSGCAAMFVGIESVSKASLESVGKNFNQTERFSEQIGKFHDCGIMLNAGMIVGLDGDDESVFDGIFEFLVKNKVEISLINIQIPLPGTALYRRYKKEGRLIDDDWEHYDGRRVVFQPSRMTPERLERGFFELWESLYSNVSIIERLLSPAQICRALKSPAKLLQTCSRVRMNARYGEIASRIKAARFSGR
ncbi:MAG: B12-binding domain-containing radical SAM protein [Parcubacteria group bacterium]|nr:B12-binding domain-containing radical SAM protein [Parcubacteria group bacterium]